MASTIETIWKNKLQEYCQKNALKLPQYKEQDLGLEALPLRWNSTCILTLGPGNEITATSETPSASKREAEQKAARRVYQKLHGDLPDQMSNLSVSNPTTPPVTSPVYSVGTPQNVSSPQRVAVVPTYDRTPLESTLPHVTSPLRTPIPPPTTLPVHFAPVTTVTPATTTATTTSTTAKISSTRGAARSRLQKALTEEGLPDATYVFRCIVYLPDGTTHESDAFAEPKRAEDEAAQKAFEYFTEK